MNLSLQEKKTKRLLQELEDQEKSAREAREREARGAQLDIAIANARREREREQVEAEDRAEASRQEWQSQWLNEMLAQIPQDVPPDLKLEIVEMLQQKLPELYETSAGHAEHVVQTILRTAVQKALQPWRRNTEAKAAAAEALNELPFVALGSWGQVSEWEQCARERALAAIAALPDRATLEQMAAAARTADRHVSREYSHHEKCESFIAEICRSLPGRLAFSSSQARAKAAEAVRAAVAALPIGASGADFEDALERALAPFSAADAQVRAEHDAQQAEHQASVNAQQASAKLKAEAKKHLDRVFYYLAELSADPEGWDFEGKIFQYARQIAEEIEPALLEEMPLDFLAGRRRVQELVDEWLASHCSV